MQPAADRDALEHWANRICAAIGAIAIGCGLGWAALSLAQLAALWRL